MQKAMVINHIGISGGKDSTALLLWALFESGYPRESIVVTFCDTDNEHDLTYEHVHQLSKLHPITWLTMEAFMIAKGWPPVKGFYGLAAWKRRFPGAKSRFCTQFLKIFPTRYYIDTLQALLSCDVIMHSGVRAAESDSRAKLMQREDVRPGVSEYRPLLKWSIQQVWDIHARYGIKPNPLYEMGAKRVGCLPCIMSRKADIANIHHRWPDKISRIRSEEQNSLNWHSFNDEGATYYHSFFPRDKVPRRFRSKKVRTADGREMVVCTVDDVVAWATFKPDYEQIGLPMEERTEAQADKTACDSSLGYCE
jgi:3'-phosphoadenosine 5'-phosphosulfate sulfotransferase (PAPS reductase)/FAD synthetase